MDGNDGQLLEKVKEVAFENRNDNDNMGKEDDCDDDDGDFIPLITKLKQIQGSSSTMKSPSSMIKKIKHKQRKPSEKGKLKLPTTTTTTEKV